MPIRPVGYTGSGWNYGGAAYKPPPVPKPAPIVKPPPAVGYGGSGWNYGGQSFAIPRNQSITPGGATSILGGGSLPPGPPPPGGPSGPPTVTTQTIRDPQQVYQGEILSDWQSQGAQDVYNASKQGAFNTARDAIRQKLIGGGWTPDLGQFTGSLGEFKDVLDQTTRDAIAANQLSTRGQLDKALKQSTYDVPWELAARGAGASGALATTNTALQEQYQAQSQQGLNDLLGALQGYGSDYAGQVNQYASQLDAVRSAVAQRLAQQRGYSESTTTTYGGDWGGEAPQPQSPLPPKTTYTPQQQQKLNQLVTNVKAAAKQSAPYTYKSGGYWVKK